MRHIRVDGFGESPPHEDEALITALIPAARQLAEDWTGRTLVPSTWEMRLDTLGDVTRLRRPAVQSVTEVSYLDSDGVRRILDPTLWVFNGYAEYPVIRRAYQAIWPVMRVDGDAVRITYEAGPTDGESPNPDPLPRAIYQAMLLIIGHMYENRETTTPAAVIELPIGARALLHPYRTELL